MNNLIRRLRGLPPLVPIDLIGLPRFYMETHGKADIFVSTAIEDWGNWDGSGTATVLQLLRGDADFLDIGANIGWYTLVAAHALAGRGHVHSFEPDPAHIAKLRRNVAVNGLGNVTVNALALSNRGGEAVLHRNGSNLGDHSLLPSEHRGQTTTVPLGRLDDYAGLGRERPLVIKLDVQGTEIDVLDGARGILESYPHEIVLLCEISPAALATGGRTPEELADLLDGLGFAGARVDRSRPRVVPMSWERIVAAQLAEDAENPGADSDVLAYRRIDGLMAPIFGGTGFRTA